MSRPTASSSQSHAPLYDDVTIEADVSDDEADLLHREDPMTAHLPKRSNQGASGSARSGAGAGTGTGVGAAGDINEAPATSLSSAQFQNRPYTGPNTLDEPVTTTIYNDLRAIGVRLRGVLYPPLATLSALRAGADSATAAASAATSTTATTGIDRSWDLWGPLVFCLTLSLALSYTGGGHQSVTVFTGVFTLTWLGFMVCTVQAKLLGARVHFFHAVCAMGYALFPLAAAAVVAAFVPLALVRVPASIVACAWSTWAAGAALSVDAHLGGKTLLALYPVALFYAVLAWTVLVSG